MNYPHVRIGGQPAPNGHAPRKAHGVSAGILIVVALGFGLNLPGQTVRTGAGTPAGAETTPIDLLREELYSLELIFLEVNQSLERQETLEQQLAEKKNSPPPSIYQFDNLWERREIERLQSQLHLTIQRADNLREEARQVVKTVLKERMETRNWLDKQIGAKRAQLDKGSKNSKDAPRLQAELAEMRYFKELLEVLDDDPEKAEGELQKRLTGATGASTAQGPSPGHARGDRRGGPPRLTGKAAVRQLIQGLEYEQETLLRKWQQNEASLRRLQRMLDQAEDAGPGDGGGSEKATATPEMTADSSTGAPAPLLRPEALVQGRPRPLAPAGDPTSPRP